MGNIWFRFLAKIGTITVPKIIPVVLTGVYKVDIFDNLAILYLALLTIEYPVFHSDILDWIKDGTLCYFNAKQLLPDHFKPRSLLVAALGVERLPTLKNIKERIRNVSEILDDFPKPPLRVSQLEAFYDRLKVKFSVPSPDVRLLFIGLFNSSNARVDQVNSDLEIAVGACFVIALRLFYQFENPNLKKQIWLDWFIPYQQSRCKDKVSLAVSESVLKRHSYITEKQFLNMPIDEYLNSVEAVLSQNRKVSETSELTEEFRLKVFPEKSNGPMFSTEAIMEGTEGRSGKRKWRRKEYNYRKLVVYPVDEIMEDSILPLELQMIIEDVAAHFHIDSSRLFAEIQKTVRLFVET